MPMDVRRMKNYVHVVIRLLFRRGWPVARALYLKQHRPPVQPPESWLYHNTCHWIGGTVDGPLTDRSRWNQEKHFECVGGTGRCAPVPENQGPRVVGESRRRNRMSEFSVRSGGREEMGQMWLQRRARSTSTCRIGAAHRARAGAWADLPEQRQMLALVAFGPAPRGK